MSRRIDLYQIIIALLSFAVVVAIGFLIYNQRSGVVGRSAVSVDVEHGKASVSINGSNRGETPVYTEEFFAGDIEVSINGESNTYTNVISPASGTKAIIKRDLGQSKSFSSGQNIWFTKASQDGYFVSVISPDIPDVQIIVDGVEIGKTPYKFSTKELLAQNQDNKYKITFKKDGYEPQEVEVKLSEGYELNIRVDLFLNPIPKEVESAVGLPEGVNFVNFGKASGSAFMERQQWAKAINYWLDTRSSVTLGNHKVEQFNFFIADNGKFYNSEGNEVSASEVEFQAGMFVAYLSSEGKTELSDEAKSGIEEATGSKVPDTVEGTSGGSGSGQLVEVIPTGVGFLRVRDTNSTAGREVGRVDIGKQFTVLEEKTGWYRIEYVAGKQGWISAQYTKKVTATQ